MVGVMNLTATAAFAVFVLYAVEPGPMGLDEAGFGLLMTTMAFGSLAGSLLVERAELRLGRARLLAITVVVSAVTIAMPGLTTSAWLVGAAFAASGLAIVMWNVVTVSLRQRIVPDRLLGRVNASYRLLAWGSQPIGALLGGIAGELLGLPAVFVLSGAACGMLILGMRIVTDAAIVAAEREAETAAEAAEETAGQAGLVGGGVVRVPPAFSPSGAPQRWPRPSASRSTAAEIRRSRVSSVFASSMPSTNQRRWLYESPSKKRRASGRASRASAKSGGTSTERGSVSSARSTSTSSPAATPAAARFSALSGSMNTSP